MTQSIGRNGFGQVTSVRDANNNETTYGYDGLDRPKRTTYPDNSYEELGYDAYGRVTSQRMRDGRTVGFAYDALGRRTAKNRPGDAANETNVVYEWDDLGRLVAARDSRAVRFDYGYDALGRLVRETSANGAGTLSYQYDLMGRRTLVQWGTGSDPFVQYTRLVTGEVDQVRENGATSGAGLLARYGYDDLGRRTSLDRGNGTLTTWGYGGTPWLASLAHYFPNDTAKNVTRSFTRSAAGEILTAGGSNDAYAYKDQKNADRSYARNVLNQYTGAGTSTFGYDGRGNLTSSQGETGATYGYTADNLLASSSGGNFVYDPLDRLLLQGASGSVLRYAGTDLVTELDQYGTVRRRWVHGDGADEPLVQYEGGSFSDRRWYYADERGSVIATANGSGAATALTYDEYGIPGAANGNQRFQYTGQTWLPEIGAYYYKARVYSPTLGRFLQADPIGYGDGMNLYAYVGNTPVNATDPSGLVGKSFGTGGRIIPIDPRPSEPPESEIVVRHERVNWAFDFANVLDLRSALEGRVNQVRVGSESGGGGVAAAPQRTQCPRPPANRPVGGVGTLIGGTLAAAKSGLGFGLDIFKAGAERFSASRYPGLPTSGNIRDASRHFHLSFSMSRMGGAASATQILNSIEVLGNNPIAEQRMDTYNNFVGVTMAQDPAFRGKSVDEAFDAALAGGCLITNAK